MLESKVPIRVRYAETDQMGYVYYGNYHANYLAWFESARVQMLDEVDLPYTQLEAEGYMLPVLECELKYRSPARFDDRLIVIARVTEPPRARLLVTYEVFRDSTLLATGSTTHTFVNPKGRLIRPHPKFIEIFSRKIHG